VRIHERYLFSLTITYSLTTTVLAFYAQSAIDLYLSVFIVEYFILTLLNSPLKPKTQRVTNPIGYVLFALFIVIVAFKVLQILGGGLI